ncbi:hypothetical protein [Dactylosporangium sp. CA-092794]|uniref:hypothetical protein n=1 Tax=Dactylosporangium sp. CA-092794 TaxID=3239929 RepID=UPI003D8A891D
MTDALDRLAEVGGDLFRRVGDVLAVTGIAADSPVWPLVRRVRGLPADVLDYGLRLDVDGLQAGATELQGIAERFGELPEQLGTDVTRAAWEGGGADAFGIVWEALAAHIGDGTEPATIAGRVRATAGYLEAVAGWAAGFRHELAEAIARVATSAEAVTLVTANPANAGSGANVGSGGSGANVGGGASIGAEAAAAATRITGRVLQPAADALDAADDLRACWAASLAGLEYHPPRVPLGPATIASVTRVNL